MIDLKKLKFGRKKEQDDVMSPANTELSAQPVHFVEQDAVELDLDDHPASPQNDDVLSRLGFTKNEQSLGTQSATWTEDNLQFATSQHNIAQSPQQSISTTQNSNTGGGASIEQFNAAVRSGKNALDALQEERRRNLERLRASILQSTAPSPDAIKEQHRDEFFKTKEESLLEQRQAERKRNLEEIRANMSQSTSDFNHGSNLNQSRTHSLDDEFLQFKQTEHLAKQQPKSEQQYATDDAFEQLRNKASENKSFGEFDEEFAKFRGISQEPKISIYEEYDDDVEYSTLKSKPAAQKKRMFSIIIGLGLLVGTVVAVKYFVLDKSNEEKLPDMVVTPTTIPIEPVPVEIPSLNENNDTTANIGEGEVAVVDGPITSDSSVPVEETLGSSEMTPPTTPKNPTLSVIDTTPSKVLVDESLLKQPVASDPTLIEEELAKLNELEKQLNEQQANLKAQHDDAEKLIKLKEERIRLLEAQLENKMRNRQ